MSLHYFQDSIRPAYKNGLCKNRSMMYTIAKFIESMVQWQPLKLI